MKNKWMIAALAVLMLVGAVGCKANKEEDVNVLVQEIADKLISDETQFGMSTENLDNELLAENIGLDTSLVEELYMKEPMMIDSKTLYIAKVKDTKDIETVKAAFEQKLQTTKDIFEVYLPEPYELAKKGQVVTRGKYVMLVIAQDTQKAVDDFNSFFE